MPPPKPAKHHARAHPPAHTAAHTYLQGIDVSHYQGTVDWAKVKASGATFAFAKATDGKKYTDSKFSVNWSAMQAAGLIRGAYHFGHPKDDAAAQARRFVDVVDPDHGDLQLVLDLEADDGWDADAVWDWTQDFIAEIKRQTDRPGIIYTGNYFWRDSVGNPTDNLDCPLWLADYTGTPHVPAAWTRWTFWQYTEKGTVPGISGNVDRDYFQGSLALLNKFTFP